MQALIARELVEGLGLPERQAARLLGLVPSSISQYLSGKRLKATLASHWEAVPARQIARRAARKLLEGSPGAPVVLEAALAFGTETRNPRRGPIPPEGGALPPGVRAKVPRWLRDRIAGEQAAVAECMRLAQRSRDELTRALFRQIASDSLRHAEIVASLAAYLDRGVASSPPTGITRADIEALVEREHAAEASDAADLGSSLGGMMRILWDSMESDERKHERLLESLLEAGIPVPPAARPRVPR